MPSRHPATRLVLATVATMVLAACSPAPQPSPSEDSTATAPDAGAARELTRMNDQRDAFIARCLKNVIPTENGEPATSDSCNTAFQKARQAQDAARILIQAHKTGGAASATSLEQLKTSLSQINWTDEQVGGSTLASGRVAPFDAVITQRNNRQYLAFNWSGPAGEVPVNIAYALLLEGAQLELVACNTALTDEAGLAWHVTGTDSDPFNLVTYSRVGPSGTALSSYSASTPLDKNAMTLESLQATDSDWVACN